MTICIRFKSETDEFSMLFGDSYKTWYEQLTEFLFVTKVRPYKPYYVLISKEKWISYGGLKWCCLDEFNNELKKENKNRSVDDFNFVDGDVKAIKKIKDIEKYVFGGKR